MALTGTGAHPSEPCDGGSFMGVREGREGREGRGRRRKIRKRKCNRRPSACDGGCGSHTPQDAQN